MNNRKLNIIFIGRPSFPIGGAMTKRHKYYIDYLMNIPGVSICNICTWNDGGQNKENGIYKDVVKYYNTQASKKISSFFSISKWANNILKQMYNDNYNNVVIFCSYLTMEQIPIFFAAKKLGYKIICDVVENYDALGGDMSSSMKVSFMLSKLFFYKKVDGFVAISHQIENAYKKYGKPILLLTNSAPIKSVSDKRKYNNPMQIVYTGTYASKDGLDFLVDGFEAFVDKKGNVAELILIGKGNGNAKLEDKINRNSKIKKMGFVSDDMLEKIQLSADILCMTRCNSEFANNGFPFKLSEYMATGNTILATSVGDVPLYIENKKNGLLVKPDDADAICDALIYAYEHQNECINMGKEGLNTIKKYFDVNINGNKLYQYIINLV